MSERKPILVVAHYIDGSLVKGSTLDFFPNKELFHILDDSGVTHEVHVAALKAVFFVRQLGGTGGGERKGFFGDTQPGKKILVEFFDGEVLFGHTLTYNKTGLGFFMLPGDPDANNIKVFVVHAATKRVKIKAKPLGRFARV